MNIIETLKEFDEVKTKVANELNANLDDLTELTYFKYIESSYNGYTYGSTNEEWLKMAIPFYSKTNN